MWPNSKGKGGKGSSKSNDGDDEKPRTKPRATRTKLKAMTAEAARALQETGDQPAAKPRMSPEELLEAEIFRAAEQASAEQVAREEQARAAGPEFLKIPEQSASLDDQLSGVWKARLMGASKPTPQNMAIPSPANRIAMEAAEKARTNAQHESMIGIVDRMFDQFQNLAYDFNQVASASDLELTWIRPSINRENVGNWHSGSQYISVFSGRISTRYWTLVVRGSFESITAHIIPADKLLTFSSAPANFMPMLEMMPFFDGAMVYWSAGQKQLKSEDIQQAARAVLDSLVQVAQEDVPPTRPIDLFNPNNPSSSSQITTGPLPVETAKPATGFHEPTVSALGGDIDYSERYRQHFSSDSSSNVGANPSNTSNPGNQFPVPGGFGAPGNAPANNNSFNSFRQFPPSQGSSAPPGQSFNQMGNQQGGNAQGNSDDWKPVIRSVRGAAGPQPLQHMRQFQNAATDTPSPNSPITNPPNLNAPMTPPFAAPPGRGSGPSRDDGWRGVDVNKSVLPPAGGPSGGKPPFPALPTAPALNSDSFAGGNSQSFSGQRPAPSNINAPATGDDWNFVPVEKDSPKQFPQPGQGDSGARPPVTFPSNLFADMPASLGFPASAAPGANPTERPNLPPNPSQQAPAQPSVTPTSGSFRPSFGTTKATTSSSTSSTSSTSSASNTSLPSSNASTSSNFSTSGNSGSSGTFGTSGTSGTFGTSGGSGAASSSSSSSPFARPFSAVSASKFATPASEQPEVPPAPQAPIHQALPQALPISPPPAPSAPLEEEDSEANPFYTPLAPSTDSSGASSGASSASSSASSSGTTSGASPWATAPAATSGGNKADFNPTASSTQSGMLAPPPAPLPSKEDPAQTTFFEPQPPVTDVETEETKTVEIASVGQFSADRFASEIANQVLPAPILQPAYSPNQNLGAPPAVEIAALVEEPEAKSQPEPEAELEVKIESGSAKEHGAESEAELEVVPEAKIASEPQQEAEQEPEQEDELETEVEAKTEPEPELEAEPEAELEAELEAKTEPEPEQEAEQDAAEAPEQEELEEELEAKIESEPHLELETEVEQSEEEQSEEEQNQALEVKSLVDEERLEENIDDRNEDSAQDSFDDADEDFESEADLEISSSESELESELDSAPEFVGQEEDDAEAVEEELSKADLDEKDLAEEELSDDEPSGEESNDFNSEVLQEQSLVDEDSSCDDSEEELREDSLSASAEAADENMGQVGSELASLSAIEEETVESIAELEQELTQSAAELSQSGDTSSSASSSASPWRGPTTLESSPSQAYSSHVIDSPLPMPDFAPISASLGSSAPSVVAANEHSLKSEIDRVITAFDKELELISTKGSDAFARRDLKGAEHMIKLAEMISEYKSGLAKLKDEYDKDLT